MNFLAHFYLSGDAEPLIVGNFLGDFLSNREVAALPAEIQEGVRLHRQIDTFTDQHPMVHRSTARLREVHGKYAPVILDVLHDFVLANNWACYSNVELSTFASGVYEVLLRHLPLMPGFLQERVPRMVANDWLVRYGTEDGLRFTFSRMKMRSSAPHFFENAVESLTKNYIDYEEAFHVFFPDVITAVNALLLPTNERDKIE